MDALFEVLKLDKLNAKVQYLNDETARFLLPNGYIFELERSQFVDKGDFYELTIPTGDAYDEIVGIVREKKFYSISTEFHGIFPVKPKIYEQKMTRTTAYSNHTDFRPDLRLQIKLLPVLEKYVNSDLNFGFGDESIGKMRVHEGFIFVPANAFEIKFSRAKYYYKTITPELYNSVKSSVLRQTMNVNQLNDIACRLTTLQMFYLNIDDYFDTKMGLFYILWDSNIKNLIAAGCCKQISMTDCWNAFMACQSRFVPITATREKGKCTVKEIFSGFNELRFYYPQNSVGHPSIERIQSFAKANLRTKSSFDLSVTGLLERYRAGFLSVYSEKIKTFDFYNKRYSQYIGQPFEGVMDYDILVLKHLVEDRIKEVDISKSLLSMLQYAATLGEDQKTINLIYRCSEFQLNNFYSPGLTNLFMKMPPPIPSIPERTDDIYKFINQHLSTEKRIAAIAQSELDAWAGLLRLTPQNIFNNVDYILKLARIRRVEQVGSDEPQPSTSTIFYDCQDSPCEEELNFASRILNKVKVPFKAGKEFVGKVMNVVEKIDSFEVDSFMSTAYESFQETCKKHNADYLVKTFANISFDSIGNVVASCKQLIAAFFHQLASKLCDIFGLTYTPSLDATQLLFYYLVWVRSDSWFLKYCILLDLMSSLGLLDKFVEVIKRFYNWIVSNPLQTVGSFDDFLATLSLNNQKSKEQLKESVSAMGDVITPPVKEESMIKRVMDVLSNATPTALGALGTIFVAMAGVTKVAMSPQDLGQRIVNVARNVGFLSVGISALPKIFENIMKVLTWFHDYVLSLIKKDHKTKYEKIQKVTKWLATTPIVRGVTEQVIVRDLDYCISLLSKQAEMAEIDGFIEQLNDPNLRFQYSKRKEEFNSIAGVLHSAIRIMLLQREIFHVQLWSPESGIGKTDLAALVVNTMKDKGLEMTTWINKNIIKEESELQSGVGNVYPINDTLKFADLYYGQEYLYSDEENVMNEAEAGQIVQKMTLLSGFPMISNQADLSGKGRIYTVKAMVSNTNNAFVEFRGMLKPQTLWRRRSLFKITVKPEYLTNGKLDENKLSGINRTRCEHLLVTWVDASDKNERRLHPETTEMEVCDFLKLVSQLYEKHTFTEENRLFQKDNLSTFLRARYEVLWNHMSNEVKRMSTETTNTLSRTINAYRAYLETLSESNSKKVLSENLTHLENLVPFLDKSEDKVYENIMTAEQTGFLDYVKMSDYMMVSTVVVDSKKYFRLKPCSTQQTFVDGAIDHSKFKAVEIDGKMRIVYPFDVSFVDQSVIGYYLLDYSSCDDLHKFNLRRAKNIEDSKVLKKRKTVIEEIKSATSYCAQSAKGLVQFVGSKLLEFGGSVLWHGLIAAVSVCVMFFSLSLIGQFLSPISNPEQTAYSSNFDKTRIFKQPGPVIQTSLDVLEGVPTLATKVTYKIVYPYLDSTGNSRLATGTMIGIQGSIFLVNAHVMKNLIKTTEILIYDHFKGCVDPPKGWIRKYISPTDIQFIPDHDACLINIQGFRPVRDCINQFIVDKDLEDGLSNLRHAYLGSVLLRKPGCSTFDPTDKTSMRSFEITKMSQGVETDYNATSVPDKHKFVFEFNTDIEIQRGDSGSLVFHDNTKLAGKFLGIVLARSVHSKTAYCGIITRELLLKYIAKMPFASRVVVQTSCNEVVEDGHEIKSVFKYNENVYKSPFPDQSLSKSLGFIKTKIHGQAFPVDTQPAIQDSRDSRIPEGARHHLLVSLNKSNGDDMPLFSPKEEKFAIDILKAMYVKFVPGIDTITVVSTKHAVTGMKVMGSTCIDCSTCAGLPYKIERNAKGKNMLMSFDSVTKTWQITDRLYSDVNYLRSYYSMGIVPSNYKLEFNKKELVGDNKILEPKTRTVGMGNAIHQVLYREMFSDFLVVVKNTWERGGAMPFALGVDPERHWNQVADHLKFTDFVLDFDVKAWESKMSLQLLLMSCNAMVELIERAYRSRNQASPDIRKIAECLAIDYMDAQVVFKDVVYRKSAGLLSGHPGTFIENSQIHFMILMIVVKRILDRYSPKWSNSGFILDHVRQIIAADDIVIALSPVARSVITVERIVEGYAGLGFELTAPDKSVGIYAKRLEDCQFLKHHFSLDGDSWVPVPNLSIVHQLFNWIRSDSALSFEDQFSVNMQNAFRFAWWRGREEYEDIRSKANAVLLRHQLSWEYDWDEMAVLVRRVVEENERKVFAPVPNPEQDFDF